MKVSRRLAIAIAIALSGLVFLITIGILGLLIFGQRPTAHNPSFPILFLIIVFSMGSLSALSAFYYYFPEVRPSNRRKSNPTPDSKPFEIVMFVLSDDEAEVLKAVKKLGDRTYQFEIARLTGMSRMKVHRVLKKLEDRQILQRDKEGRGSRVFLADWLN